MQIEQLLSRLNNVRPNGNGHTAQCPAHIDREPSLAVSVGSDDRLLLHCFAACTLEEIVDAIGLTVSDLFPERIDRKGSNGSPDSVLEHIAKIKHAPVEALKSYGAYEKNGAVRIPMIGPDGEKCSEFIMPADGSKGKNQRGKKAGLFLPGRLPKGGETWYLCEGVKDAAAMYDLGYFTVGLPGNVLKQEFVQMFKGVQVIMVPDRDTGGEKGSAKSASRLYGVASSVRIVQLPGEFKAKHGLDIRDVLKGKNGIQMLINAIQQAPDWEPTGDESECPYISTSAGIILLKQTGTGTESVQLSNFRATIVSEITYDDGADESIALEIEAQVRNLTKKFTIPAGKFNGLLWISEFLGAEAIVFPGYATRENLRCAIQMLSGSLARNKIYQHTGWRPIEGDWHYLHNAGAISARGMVPGIAVSMVPALEGFALPDPPTTRDLKEAIRTSIGLLNISTDDLSFPMFIAPYLATLGSVDFSIHLVGQTGAFKTELAALVQQHFGKSMDARNLPASWSSTANSLESLAFLAKDAVLVVDDFSPSGSSYQIAKAHSDADRLFRAQGNRSGRQRLRPDGTMRPHKPPRGLIVSTGEEVPKGHSVRARLLVLELEQGAVNKAVLTKCQKNAASGVYSKVMAGYVQWLAPQFGDVQDKRKIRTARFREKLKENEGHTRSPFLYSQLVFGLEIFLRFALESKSLTRDECRALFKRGELAMQKICQAQNQHQSSEEPAHRYLRLVGALITSGQAHLASKSGEEPMNAQSYGWKFVTIGSGDFERSEWRANGRCLGWVDGDNIYLEPDASFAEVQRLANAQGESIPLTLVTLRKRLDDQSLLTQVDKKRGRLTVRRTIADMQRNVIAIKSTSIF